MGHDMGTSNAWMKSLRAATEKMSNLQKDVKTMDDALHHSVTNSTVRHRAFLVRTFIDWLQT